MVRELQPIVFGCTLVPENLLGKCISNPNYRILNLQLGTLFERRFEVKNRAQSVCYLN